MNEISARTFLSEQFCEQSYYDCHFFQPNMKILLGWFCMHYFPACGVKKWRRRDLCRHFAFSPREREKNHVFIQKSMTTIVRNLFDFRYIHASNSHSVLFFLVERVAKSPKCARRTNIIQACRTIISFPQLRDKSCSSFPSPIFTNPTSQGARKVFFPRNANFETGKGNVISFSPLHSSFVPPFAHIQIGQIAGHLHFPLESFPNFFFLPRVM